MTLHLLPIAILGLMGSYNEIPHSLECLPSQNLTSLAILDQLGATFILGIITTLRFSLTLDSPPTSAPSLAIGTIFHLIYECLSILLQNL